MANYRLLRSNKESGPYNLQDLVSFGLKAYDLVWVDGKSAAWRYPSEVEELKPYAPGTEEQPYDRFYKKYTPEPKEEPVLIQEKPVEVKPIVPVVVEKAIVEQQPLVQEPAFIEEKYEKYIPKKSVFVTMPERKTVAVQKPVETTPVPPPVPPPTITVKENPAAQIKYSQPLDEIKEMYVKTLNERKSKIARKSFLLTNLKRASVIVALVALGVVAGLIINRGSDKKLASSRPSLQQVVPSAAAVVNDASPQVQQPVTEQPSLKNENTSRINKQAVPDLTTTTETVSQQTNLPPQVKERLLRQEKEEQLEKQSTRKDTPSKPPAEKKISEEIQQKPVEVDPRTGERNRSVRSDDNDIAATTDKPAAKAVLKSKKGGLESLVSVTTNDYKRVAFGGIRNLELTVTNDSRYVLDKVTVELQYLKPSEEPLRTELVQFHSVSPNGSMTMKIRDTNRGIKVAYKILEIQPAQPETALSGF